MAQDLLTLIFLFVGGFIGWSLFGITVVKLVKDRRQEIELIIAIQQRLKIVREEIEKLK